MHIRSDYVYFKIVDLKTGKVPPDGEVDELVLTTLRKQGAPLIRYRTHDLTRIIPGKCVCGLAHRASIPWWDAPTTRLRSRVAICSPRRSRKSLNS